MALSNEALARRADFVLANLDTGGLMLPEQADAFIDLITEEDTFVKQMRVERMNGPKKRIERIGFAGRIMRGAPQGTTPYAADNGTNSRYLAAADRAGPVTSMIELHSKEVMAEIRLPYEVLEDNIEKGALEQHVMRLVAKQAALDFEEWVLLADTANTGDNYLKLANGLLKTATTINNVANAGFTPDAVEAALLLMPQKYLRNLSELKHFVTIADTIRYRGNVARRSTGYGDSSLTTNNELMAYGTKIEGTPLMPAANALGSGLFTFPKNAIFGIQRDIMMETDRDIRSRELVFVLTARIDVLWDDVAAVVKYTNMN